MMDEAEARTLLDAELARLRSLSYPDLVEIYLEGVQSEIKEPSGAEYQLDVQAVWDDPRQRGGNLRVFASIDDGRGWRAFSPLTDSFFVARDGTLWGSD